MDNGVAWRFPTAFQLLFIIPILLLTFIVPESPRWLVLHNMDDDALKVISALNNKAVDDQEVKDLFLEIRESVVFEAMESHGPISLKIIISSPEEEVLVLA